MQYSAISSAGNDFTLNEWNVVEIVLFITPLEIDYTV